MKVGAEVHDPHRVICQNFNLPVIHLGPPSGQIFLFVD